MLVTLALGHWALVQMPECLASAERAVAVAVLQPGGTGPQHAYALAYLAGLQVSVDRDEEAVATGTAAVALARQLGATALVALGRIARGNARMKLGDPGGVGELCAGIAEAAAASAHVVVMTGYVVLVQNLWNAGLPAETERRIAEATAYAHERDLDIYLDNMAAHGFRCQAARGEWEAAEAGLRASSPRPGPAASAPACPSCPGCSCAAVPTTPRRCSTGPWTTPGAATPATSWPPP